MRAIHIAAIGGAAILGVGAVLLLRRSGVGLSSLTGGDSGDRIVRLSNFTADGHAARPPKVDVRLSAIRARFPEPRYSIQSNEEGNPKGSRLWIVRNEANARGRTYEGPPIMRGGQMVVGSGSAGGDAAIIVGVVGAVATAAATAYGGPAAGAAVSAGFSAIASQVS